MERSIDHELLSKLVSKLSVVPLDQSKLTLSDHKPDAIKEFIAQLPSSHAEAGKRLYLILRELASLQIPARDRLTLLNKLCPATLQCAGKLSRTRLSDKTAKVVSLSQALLKHLASGYRTALHEFAQKPVAQLPIPQMTQAIYHALHIQGVMYLKSMQFYLSTPKRFWLDLHSLYRIANLLQITEVPNPGKAPGSTPTPSINAEYLRTILLACGHPNHLSSNDLGSAYNALEDWSALANLATGHTKGIHTIDTSSDLPPFYSSKERGAKQHYLKLYTTPLVANLETKLRNFPNAAVIDHVSPRLIRSLCYSWTEEQSRQQERHPQQTDLKMMFGLAHIHGVLAGSPDFDNYLQQQGVDTPSVANTNIDEALPHQHMDATLLNRSEHGSCLELSCQELPKLTPGELIATREEDRDWQLGVVRWKHTTPQLHLQLGVEYFPHRPTPCAARVTHANRSPSPYLPALSLGTDGESLQQLVVPIMPFKHSDHVQLLDHQHPSGAARMLSLPVDNTAFFTRFTLSATDTLGPALEE